MRNSSRLKYVRSESFLHSERTYVLFLLVHVPDGFFLSASAALSTYSAAKSPRISSISIYAGLFVPGHTAHSRSFGVFCTIGSSRLCRLAAMMRPFISVSREIASFDLPRTDQAFLIKTDQIRSALFAE